MKITYEELKKYHTTKGQVLIKFERQSYDLGLDKVFSMKNNSEEIKQGIIVSSDEEHLNYEGCNCIFTPENSIALDAFVDIDDAENYEYRLVQLNRVMLIQNKSKKSIKE